MFYIVFVSFSLIILSGIHCLESPQSTLTIGVILDANDEITRKVTSLAVQIANIELAHYNYRLQLKTESIEENTSFYVIRKACNLLQNGLVAIISPIAAVPSRHVSSLCSKFHIPHLVTTCRFPESFETYEMDVKISPDCNQYSNIIYQYITKVENWKNMMIIHSSNYCILKFESLINQFEFQMKMRQWVHHDRKKNKELMRELSKSKNHHNFLVDIPYWQITEFLIMASVHNMTEPQYSFIFTDWDSSLVDIAAFKINNPVNITTFSIVNQSYIEQIKLIGPSIGSLIRSIIEKEKSTKKADIITKFMAQPAIIFDSISLLTKGLIRLIKNRKVSVIPLSCSKNATWELGPSLINAITSIEDISGTTGKIMFNEKAQRKDYNVSVMELTENGFEKSAYWAEDQITILPKIVIPSSTDNTIPQRPLRVTTKIEIPFVFYGDPKVHDNFDPNPIAWKGYCIELLEKIGDDLKLNFSIHVVADKSYGMSVRDEKNPDGTEKWTGMIGELITKKADLAVAPMTITYEREKVVDFTTPFMSLGLSILFLRPKPEPPGLFSFLSPLSPTVWVYVISAYVGVSFILFAISHITPYEWLHSHPCDDKSETSNQFHLLNSLWFAVGALVRQGCDLPPQASSTRLIAGAWWFFTLIIISTYTANLAAFLTVEQLILPIKNAEDLANQTKIKYGTLIGGSSLTFFEKALIPTYKQMYKFMLANPNVLQNNVDNGINRVLNDNGKYAFLMESSWIDYYVQKHCNLIKVGDLLDSKGYGIGFPEGSPLRDKMSESILKLQKDQILDALKHKWWNIVNISEPCNVKERGKVPEPLNVYQVGGVFVLLGAGFIIAALIAILELYIRYKDKKCQYKIPFCSFACKELKFAMRFMSSSKKVKKTNISECKSRERMFLLEHSEGPDNDMPVNIHLTHPIEKVTYSPNILNRRQNFNGISNSRVGHLEYFKNSHDIGNVPNSKFIWGLHNDI